MSYVATLIFPLLFLFLKHIFHFSFGFEVVMSFQAETGQQIKTKIEGRTTFAWKKLSLNFRESVEGFWREGHISLEKV